MKNYNCVGRGLYKVVASQSSTGRYHDTMSMYYDQASAKFDSMSDLPRLEAIGSDLRKNRFSFEFVRGVVNPVGAYKYFYERATSTLYSFNPNNPRVVSEWNSFLGFFSKIIAHPKLKLGGVKIVGPTQDSQWINLVWKLLYMKDESHDPLRGCLEFIEAFRKEGNWHLDVLDRFDYAISLLFPFLNTSSSPSLNKFYGIEKKDQDLVLKEHVQKAKVRLRLCIHAVKNKTEPSDDLVDSLMKRGYELVVRDGSSNDSAVSFLTKVVSTQKMILDMKRTTVVSSSPGADTLGPEPASGCLACFCNCLRGQLFSASETTDIGLRAPSSSETPQPILLDKLQSFLASEEAAVNHLPGAIIFPQDLLPEIKYIQEAIKDSISSEEEIELVACSGEVATFDPIAHYRLANARFDMIVEDCLVDKSGHLLAGIMLHLYDCTPAQCQELFETKLIEVIQRVAGTAHAFDLFEMTMKDIDRMYETDRVNRALLSDFECEAEVSEKTSDEDFSENDEKFARLKGLFIHSSLANETNYLFYVRLCSLLNKDCMVTDRAMLEVKYLEDLESVPDYILVLTKYCDKHPEDKEMLEHIREFYVSWLKAKGDEEANNQVFFTRVFEQAPNLNLETYFPTSPSLKPSPPTKSSGGGFFRYFRNR